MTDEMILVRAVEGRVLPFDPRDRKDGQYIGYRQARDGESADHVIPCRMLHGQKTDKRFVRDEQPTSVRNALYYRLAIESGDIERVDAAQQAAEPPKSKRAKGEV